MTAMIRRLMHIILISSLLAGCGTGLAPVVQNRQLLTFGNMGDNPGQFREPRQITFTPRATLLVGDFRNYRFQELTVTGQPLGMWGRRGNEPGQFLDPTSAAMDSKGNIYAVDTWNHRIQKFSAETGIWTANWAQAEFYAPRGIAVGRDDLVYIVNTSHHSVHVFSPDGKQLARWGDGKPGVETFHDPIGIAAGRDGNFYVADPGNARVKVMDPGGREIRLIHVEDWNREEFLEGYIALDSKGFIYVTSPHNNKIIVYTPEGRMFSRFGAYGSGPEEMNTPTGIAIDGNDHVIISDSMNHRIVVYAPPPPLPEYEADAYRAENTLSRIRWSIDTLALIIILLQLRHMIRKRRNRPRSPGFLDRHPRWIRVFFAAGLVLSGLSVISLQINRYITAGGIGLIAGTIALAFGMPSGRWIPLLPAEQYSRRCRWIAIGVLTLIAVFLRFYRLDEIPSGINNDAAWNGSYALRILEGEPYTPFTDEAWGKETLYFYMIAASFKLLGISVTSLYLPCILASLFTALVIFWFGRQLWNWRTATIAAAIHAFMAWNLTFSRTGYRAVLAPLVMVLASGLFFRAVDTGSARKKLMFFTGCGAAIGIGLNTYFSFRSVPVMMILIGLHSWSTTPRFMRRNWWGLILLFVSAVVIFLPLGLFALKNPETFLNRTSFLFVGNQVRSAGSLKPLWDNLIGNLQILHYQANVGNFFIPERPIITAPIGFLMMIGLAYTLRFFKHRDGFWLLMTVVFGLLPGYLSRPDATRLILLTVPIAIMSAIGLGMMADLAGGVMSGPLRKSLPVIVITGGLALILAAEFHFYFYTLATSYHAQFGYAPAHTKLGLKAVELSRDYKVYISNSHFLDTPKFICHDLPKDTFRISNGREVDFVTNEEVMDNLRQIAAERRHSDRKLAFLLDHCDKNLFVMKQIDQLIPGLERSAYKDKNQPQNNPPYYYMMRETNQSIGKEGPTP